MTEEWKVVNEDTGTVEDDVHDLTIMDAVNRYARHAEIKLIDYDGVKHKDYQKGLPVRIEVKPQPSDSFSTRFGGFVADVERDDEHTIISVYGYDLWLRRRDVLRTYSDQTVEYILEDLIKNLTPLTWDSSQIDIWDNQTISRQWQGESLDEVIRELASISGDENFGVDNTGTFFFERRSVESAPTNLDDSNIINADFDKPGRDDLNQVKIFYGEGDAKSALIVADREDQQELADELGRPRPVVVETSKNFPEIDNEEAARRKGQRILNGNIGVLKGDVTTFGHVESKAGQILHVESKEHDIDTQFRIGEIEYNELSGETKMKLAENSQGVIDTLVDMSQEVTRVDLRDADASVTPTQIVSLTDGLDFEISVSAWKVYISEDALIWGESKGGWGEPDIGGGYYGDPTTGKDKIL